MIVLHWIRGEARKWKTFVANRVREIQDSCETSKWAHVRTEDNPADKLTRGLSARALISDEFWWHGPK